MLPRPIWEIAQTYTLHGHTHDAHKARVDRQAAAPTIVATVPRALLQHGLEDRTHRVPVADQCPIQRDHAELHKPSKNMKETENK